MGGEPPSAALLATMQEEDEEHGKSCLGSPSLHTRPFLHFITKGSHVVMPKGHVVREE